MRFGPASPAWVCTAQILRPDVGTSRGPAAASRINPLRRSLSAAVCRKPLGLPGVGDLVHSGAGGFKMSRIATQVGNDPVGGAKIITASPDRPSSVVLGCGRSRI